MNIDTNYVISDSVDSSWSLLSKYTKILNFHLNSLFDFIKFEANLKNSLILRGFDPYSLLFSLILNYNLKFVSLETTLRCICVYSMTSQIHSVKQALLS